SVVYNRQICIRYYYIGDFAHSYLLPKKHHNYEQKQATIHLYNLIKEVYNEHLKLQKKLYKESK
ncbi:MAG: hypothetical protein K2K50_01415, partial [Anaeroplasmataceae bacterium]|nr:hypothetical protein [Anaeroplasmataceae bacterium]